MGFIKFFFQDSGNKVFCWFVILFTMVFFVIGSLVKSINMTWHDIFPMYIILGAIMLTLVIYSWTRYRSQNKEEEDDKIVIRGSDKKM